MTSENTAPAEMPVASHGIASGETQPDLCSTAATQAPAAMPSVEEIRDLLCGYVPTLDASTEAARAILDLFAPILAEKELHHTTGERITRKDLNNAHRKGAEEGRLAAHLIDGVNSPLNACCYRDECRALEARALAAEAARDAFKLALIAEKERADMATRQMIKQNNRLAALAQIAAPGAAMEAL